MQNFLDRIRDLTTTREAGFGKILAWDEVLEKQTVFGIEVMEVRDEESLWKKKRATNQKKPPLKKTLPEQNFLHYTISLLTREHG